MVPVLDPQMSAMFTVLQSLDDAIAFRLDRLNLPCQRCAPDRKCDDHAHDEQLVQEYQDRYAFEFSDARSRIDPDALHQVMQPGDGTPPTVALLSAAILTRLRHESYLSSQSYYLRC